MVLEVALNGSADCIVTHNVRDFRQAIPKSGIPVRTPGGLLERLEDEQSDVSPKTAAVVVVLHLRRSHTACP